MAGKAVGVAAAVVFTAFPEVDLAAAVAARVATDSALDGMVGALRMAAMAAFAAFSAAVAVAAVVCLSGRRLLLSASGWAFVLACLAIGPGLVTNAVFKDHWGRARPRDTAELGGPARFTQALLPARECRRNCSFVSGEASATFMAFFALGMAIPRRRLALFAAGSVAGLAVGALRMMQGAHFLSDVVFAGLIMAFVAWALHGLLACAAAMARRPSAVSLVSG